MFDKKQRSIKRIHLVTADGLYDRKAFYKVEIVFIHPLGNKKVVLNTQTSNRKNIHAGVSQCYVLGPLLFLIYINELAENHLQIQSFLLMTLPYFL